MTIQPEQIQPLLYNHLDWIDKRSKLNPAPDDAVRITLPFLDRDKCYINIFASEGRLGIVLSDRGATIKGTGVSLKTATTIARSFGVSVKENCILSIETFPDNFPGSIQDLLQTILALQNAK